MASLRARMAALMEASGGHAEPAPIGHAAALGPAMRVVSAAVAARPLSSVSPPPFDAAVGAAAVAGQQQTPGVPADTRDADDGDKATSAGEAQPQDVSVRALLSEEDLQFEGLSSKPWLRLIPKAVRQAVSAPQAGGSDDAMPSDDASRQLAARHPLAAIPGILAGAAGPQEGEELFHEDVSATVGRKRKAQSAPVRGGSRGTHRVARSTSGSAGQRPAPFVSAFTDCGDDDEAHPDLANAPVAGPSVDLVVRLTSAGEFAPEKQRLDEADDGGDDPGSSGDDGSVALELRVPAGITKYLRPYQQEGVRFLCRQYARGIGGILADDMGLGKTVQTIAFLAALLGKGRGLPATDVEPGSSRNVVYGSPEEVPEVEGPEEEAGRRRPILILSPSSVVANWQNEFGVWGSFHVVKYHGSAADKEAAFAAIASHSAEVLITTYDSFKEDLLRIQWHVAVLDEAHLIKNHATERWKAVARLRTVHRFGLSGTVMQNSYKEVWSVMDWVHSGCFGTLSSFQSNIMKPILKSKSKEATHEEQFEGAKAAEEFKDVLRMHLLNRTKEGVIKDQLPRKRDKIVFCEMSQIQLAAYRRTLESPDFIYLKSSLPCDCGSGSSRAECCYSQHPGSQEDRHQTCIIWRHYHLCDCNNAYDPYTNPKGCRFHRAEGCGDRPGCPWCLLMPAITTLRNIANHLDLIKGDPEIAASDPRKYRWQRQLAQVVLGEDVGTEGLDIDRSFLRSSDASASGKLSALQKLLDLWGGQLDSKVLIFSHRARMLKLVEAIMIRKGYTFEVLTGSTPQKERQVKVDSFNLDAATFAFLISTKAGGLGLNLTSANKVVIIDPSYNPADDLQAMDRAFRIGQRRDVNVYRLVSTGTIEEVVYARQLYKQQQSRSAIEGTDEKRHFAAVQSVKGREGELWGLANLLELTNDTIKVMDTIADHDRREREVAEHLAGLLSHEFEAPPQAATGAIADLDRPLDGEAAEGEEDDPLEGSLKTGVQKLAEGIMRAEGLLPARPTDTDAATAEERRVLGEAGVDGLLNHTDQLNASGVEKLITGTVRLEVKARQAALAAAAATLAGEGGGITASVPVGRRKRAPLPLARTQRPSSADAPAAEKEPLMHPALDDRQRLEGCSTALQEPAAAEVAERSINGGSGGGGEALLQLTALESLAAWRGVTPASLARQLLAMQPHQRDELRLQYAAEHISAA